MGVPVVMVSGLLGALAWISAYVLDRADPGHRVHGIVDALTWGGLALLTIAVLGAGAGLVSRGATWLRVLVAVCLVALVGSLLQVLREGVDPLVVHAGFGVIVAAVALGRLLRTRRRTPPPARRSHLR